jgi:hypothetical protein
MSTIDLTMQLIKEINEIIENPAMPPSIVALAIGLKDETIECEARMARMERMEKEYDAMHADFTAKANAVRAGFIANPDQAIAELETLGEDLVKLQQDVHTCMLEHAEHLENAKVLRALMSEFCE